MSTGGSPRGIPAENEVFVTAFYGIYDPGLRQFSYSCAGHNPPQLKRCSQGRVDTLEEVGGPPLGLFEEVGYAQATLTLRPGDTLVLYTDGVTEAMNSRNAAVWPDLSSTRSWRGAI